jgi:hypothetical protein
VVELRNFRAKIRGIKKMLKAHAPDGREQEAVLSASSTGLKL